MFRWDGRQARQEAQRLLLCTAALAAGVWLLLRGLHTLAPAGRVPAPYDLAAAVVWAALSVLLGAALCASSVGLAVGRAWGWVAASLLAPVVLTFGGALWWLGDRADWWLLLWGAVLLLALSAPAAREAYLGRAPDEPASL